MKRMRRWSVGGTALMLLGSCTTVENRPQVQPVPPSARADKPTPQPRRAPGPVTFSYSGPRMQGGAVIGIAPAGTSMLTFNGVPVPVTGDGRFLIAFDRDAPPSATLVATLEDGRQVSDALVVAPRAWLIERLSTLPRFPKPEPEMARLRPAELAQIAAARRIRSDSSGWRQAFLWPATGRISGMFGSQRVYRGEPGAYHSGTDIARPAGTPVLAPADGVVILAADHPFTLEGNLLMIDHGMELNSAFLHLSRIDVHVGERVRRGQTIGAVGMSGRATGPHLHWGLKWRDSRIDPLLLAGPMPTAQ
jgi:murein DD-endopeptidase MepM/ murein hydrolase activator NlpD